MLKKISLLKRNDTRYIVRPIIGASSPTFHVHIPVRVWIYQHFNCVFFCKGPSKGSVHSEESNKMPTARDAYGKGLATYSETYSRVVALLFLYSRSWTGLGGQSHAPADLLPIKTRYPLYRRLGWHQGRSGRVRKISPPPGFDPRTVQPVASRYTD